MKLGINVPKAPEYDKKYIYIYISFFFVPKSKYIFFDWKDEIELIVSSGVK